MIRLKRGGCKDGKALQGKGVKNAFELLLQGQNRALMIDTERWSCYAFIHEE